MKESVRRVVKIKPKSTILERVGLQDVVVRRMHRGLVCHRHDDSGWERGTDNAIWMVDGTPQAFPETFRSVERGRDPSLVLVAYSHGCVRK